MRRLRAFVYILSALLLIFTACSEAPPEAAKETTSVAPPAPVDGQTAFFRMFTAARGWAPDAQGLRLQSLHLDEIKPENGKFGAWRASFLSPSKGRVAVFNYSVMEIGGKLQKGVFQDHEEGYTAGLDKPWPATALKTSSERAFQVAMERKESQEYSKKNPEIRISILLEHTNRHASTAWRVVWGESVSRSGFSVFVDASTGNYLEVMR